MGNICSGKERQYADHPSSGDEGDPLSPGKQSSGSANFSSKKLKGNKKQKKQNSSMSGRGGKKKTRSAAAAEDTDSQSYYSSRSRSVSPAPTVSTSASSTVSSIGGTRMGARVSSSSKKGKSSSRGSGGAAASAPSSSIQPHQPTTSSSSSGKLKPYRDVFDLSSFASRSGSMSSSATSGINKTMESSSSHTNANAKGATSMSSSSASTTELGTSRRCATPQSTTGDETCSSSSSLFFTRTGRESSAASSSNSSTGRVVGGGGGGTGNSNNSSSSMRVVSTSKRKKRQAIDEHHHQLQSIIRSGSGGDVAVLTGSSSISDPMTTGGAAQQQQPASSSSLAPFQPAQSTEGLEDSPVEAEDDDDEDDVFVPDQTTLTVIGSPRKVRFGDEVPRTTTTATPPPGNSNNPQSVAAASSSSGLMFLPMGLDTTTPVTQNGSTGLSSSSGGSNKKNKCDVVEVEGTVVGGILRDSSRVAVAATTSGSGTTATTTPSASRCSHSSQGTSNVEESITASTIEPDTITTTSSPSSNPQEQLTTVKAQPEHHLLDDHSNDMQQQHQRTSTTSLSFLKPVDKQVTMEGNQHQSETQKIEDEEDDEEEVDDYEYYKSPTTQTTGPQSKRNVTIDSLLLQNMMEPSGTAASSSARAPTVVTLRRWNMIVSVHNRMIAAASSSSPLLSNANRRKKQYEGSIHWVKLNPSPEQERALELIQHSTKSNSHSRSLGSGSKLSNGSFSSGSGLFMSSPTNSNMQMLPQDLEVFSVQRSSQKLKNIALGVDMDHRECLTMRDAVLVFCCAQRMKALSVVNIPGPFLAAFEKLRIAISSRDNNPSSPPASCIEDVRSFLEDTSYLNVTFDDDFSATTTTTAISSSSSPTSPPTTRCDTDTDTTTVISSPQVLSATLCGYEPQPVWETDTAEKCRQQQQQQQQQQQPGGGGGGGGKPQSRQVTLGSYILSEKRRIQARVQERGKERHFKMETQMGWDEVLPGLYCGSYHSAGEVTELRKFGITAVVSCVGPHHQSLFENQNEQREEEKKNNGGGGGGGGGGQNPFLPPYASPLSRSPANDFFVKSPEELDEQEKIEAFRMGYASCYRIEEVEFLAFNMRDLSGYYVNRHFADCVAFFRTHYVENGENVLIHCGAGVSRASTMMAACLCECLGLSPTYALEIIRNSRPGISPNEWFVYLLMREYGTDNDKKRLDIYS